MTKLFAVFGCISLGFVLVLLYESNNSTPTEVPVTPVVPPHRYTTVCLDGVEYWERKGGSYVALSARFDNRGHIVQCG